MTTSYFMQSRPEMARFLPTGFRRTLEVGCGAGGFTRSHLTSAEERWGIEPDAEAGRAAGEHVDVLLVGTFDDVADRLPAHHFDLVVCNDVIEHMPDHDRFLRDIRGKMTPGGYLVGSVPNVRHFTALAKLLLSKDWPYKDDGILDRTHLRFFTERSLRRSLEAGDFEVQELAGIRSIIKDGIVGLSPAKNLAARLAAAALVGLSLGWWSDTQFPQIAWRAKLA